jgi:hypothetical protein
VGSYRPAKRRLFCKRGGRDERSANIDFDNLPMPDEGILATHFLTVRNVAASRTFYS